MDEDKEQFNPKSWQFCLGLFLFILGWVCPLFIPLVTNLNLETATKAFLSGFLLIGAPEIFSVLSIILLGKPGYFYIKNKAFSLLKRAVPRGEVSRTRYRFGLMLLLLHIIYAYLTFYAPDLIMWYAENRITMNIIADFLFIVTLFVLGGEFWEKLRALFIYDAKANIPKTQVNSTDSLL
ncbi:MAG: hypothetical protein DIZ78_15535 [endosymbiont of Escarpia spicata]|uniref:Transporter suffix domain-containing protein n=1 Tax=endosymbiont of Escarpia spicata TaxID=2200908 RepID=A0A370DAE7_9GAMM|nr:MAG: hypothetical protein DIZ78_15535 [endosymbiont of Escarpia spicata]